MKIILITLMASFALANTKPTLPLAFVDTNIPQQTGTITTVTGDLQLAINAAKPGDTLVLENGVAFTGNYVLPEKPNPDKKWITIQSKILPIAGRLNPKLNNLAKILTPNSLPALETRGVASFYRLVGLEIAISPAAPLNYEILALGRNDSTQISLAQVPHHIILDRVYVHGLPTIHTKRGVGLNSADTAIIDSYFSEIHGWGQDAQAIAGFNGPGPYKITNNYLEASTENVMFGGTDPVIPNLIPSDIEITRNNLFKPLAWRNPVPGFETKGAWLVKNLFELKNAQRVLVEGNVMENNWKHGQSGFAVLFTPRNQDGKCPWCGVRDITFKNNIVRHSGSAVSISGVDDNYPSANTARLLIENNLFEDINGVTYSSYGACYMTILKGLTDVTINNNTCIQTQHILMADQNFPMSTLEYSNNLTNHNDYGIFGTGASAGNLTINTYFPGSTFKHNAIVRNIATSPGAKSYPLATTYPDVSGESFVFTSTLDEAKTISGVGVDMIKVQRAIDGVVPTFVPAVPANWIRLPISVEDALNQLAERLKKIEDKLVGISATH